MHAAVPAKRNLFENDVSWRDHKKKKKLEVQNESDAATISVVELLHSPASHYESTMLELSRAWEPKDRARAW